MIFGFLLSYACHIIWQDDIIFSSQHEADKGGVVTFLSPCLHSAIISHGSDPMHRIIWLFLSINNHSFRVINVYSSNDVVEISQMWGWLLNNLLPATWVMFGDFNMVEVASDKDGIFPFHWTVGEMEA